MNQQQNWKKKTLLYRFDVVPQGFFKKISHFENSSVLDCTNPHIDHDTCILCTNHFNVAFVENYCGLTKNLSFFSPESKIFSQIQPATLR